MKKNSSIFRKTIISSILLQLVSLSQAHADTTFSVTDGSTHVISGLFDSNTVPAITIDGPGSSVSGLSDVVVTTTGLYASGVVVTNGGSLSLDGASVSTAGPQSHGVYNVDGFVDIKGGTIGTSGQSSHGLAISGTDSKTMVDGSTITANGLNAYGIYAESGAELTINNSTITSAFDDGIALFGEGTKVFGSNNTFNVGIPNSDGWGRAIVLYNSGDYVKLTDTTINIVDGYVGATVYTGAELMMTGLKVNSASSHLSHVFSLEHGGVLNITDANIELVHGSLYSASGDSNNNTSILLTNVNAATDDNNYAMMSSINYTDVKIIGGNFLNIGSSRGISHYGIESTLLAEDIQLTTQGTGVQNDGTAVINNSIITTNGLNGMGIVAGSGSDKVSNTQLSNVQITTKGNGAIGINNAGTFVAGDSTISTSGNNAHGVYSHMLYAFDPTTRKTVAKSSDLNALGMAITTSGMSSAGLKADGGSLVNITDSTINTLGNNSHGLWLGDDTSYGLWLGDNNRINLANSQVIAKGADAYGIYAAEASRTHNQITLDNTTISSEQSSGLVSSGATIDLELKNGSQLSAGNGVLASVRSTYGNNGFNQGSVNINADNQSVLNGDLQADQSSIINLALTNASIWSGAAENANNINIDRSSSWNLTGDADIAMLNLAGQLNFTPGNSYRSSGTDFSTLTVNGDMAGNGGMITMNVALGNDNSPSDKLVVLGDTSGNTGIQVKNAGGTGDLTVNGIQLVSVAGQSNGEFTLQGRAVAGAYEYQLAKGGVSTPDDGGWYLRSGVMPDPIPDPTPDPTIDPTPDTPVTPVTPVTPITPVGPYTPTIRPEAGSYVANMAAASKLFNLRLEDREGRAENSSMWLRQQGDRTKFRDSSGQIKTSTNTYVIQGGGEVTQTQFTDSDRLGVGLMLGYGKSDSESGNSRSGYGSKGTVDGYSAGVYATWYQDAKTLNGAYIDSWIQYSLLNGEVDGEQLSSEKYDMDGLSASVESGYRMPIYQGENGHVFVTPQAQITWNGIKADEHTEANGTRVRSDGNNNIQTRLGVKLSRDGVSDMDKASDKLFTTYVEANWLHNTKQASATMDNVSIKQSGNTNVGELKVGAEGKLNQHVNLWTNVAQQMGDQGYSDTALTVGLKYTF